MAPPQQIYGLFLLIGWSASQMTSANLKLYRIIKSMHNTHFKSIIWLPPHLPSLQSLLCCRRAASWTQRAPLSRACSPAESAASPTPACPGLYWQSGALNQTQYAEMKRVLHYLAIVHCQIFPKMRSTQNCYMFMKIMRAQYSCHILKISYCIL